MDPWVNQLQANIGHLARKVDAMERAHAEGFIKTLNELKEGQEKVAEAIAYNAEALKLMRGLSTNQGAVYAEQIPGKREPYFVPKDLTIAAGSTNSVSESVTLSASGPMEATQVMGIAKMSVPVSSDGVATITRQTRFRPINSLFDPLASPNPAAATQPSYTPNITVNGCCDFLWRYQTARSARQRMNAGIPIPSAFLSVDRPLYLSCGDLWAAADAIQIDITPLFASFAWIGGVPGPSGAAVVDTAQPVVITMTFGCVLYTQAPSYTP